MPRQKKYRVLHYDIIVLVTIVLVFVGIHLADFMRIYPESRKARIDYAHNAMECMKEEASLRANTAFATFYAYWLGYTDYIYNPDSVYTFCSLLANSMEQIIAVAVVPSPGLYPGNDGMIPTCVPYISPEPYDASGYEYVKKLAVRYRHECLKLKENGVVDLYAEPAEIEINGFNHHVMLFGYPVTGEDGKLDASIVVGLSMDNLADFLDNMNKFESGEFYIMSGDGNFLAHPNRNMIGKKVGSTFLERYGPEADSIIRLSASDGKDRSLTDDDGEYLMWSAGCIDESIWSMFYAVKTKEVLSPLAHDTWYIVSVTVIGALIILLVCSLNIKSASDNRARESSLDKELELAAKMQSSFLCDPEVQSPEISVASYLKPAWSVGGDIYFYKEIHDKLYFCIGDVSGKGVSAAFIMSRLVSLLHVFTHMSSSPAEILKNLDREVCRNNSQFHFVTFFLGILDLHTGNLVYCNAGHDQPLVSSPSRPASYAFMAKDMPLGVATDRDFKEQTVALEPDTTILLYTDGVTEAMDDNRKLYGSDRLLNVFASHAASTPSDTVNAVLKDVEKFASHQSDDITLLAIKYSGSKTETL